MIGAQRPSKPCSKADSLTMLGGCRKFAVGTGIRPFPPPLCRQISPHGAWLAYLFLSPLSPNLRFPFLLPPLHLRNRSKASSSTPIINKLAHLIHFIAFDHLIMTGRKY